jgi:hypothetical protein
VGRHRNDDEFGLHEDSTEDSTEDLHEDSTELMPVVPGGEGSRRLTASPLLLAAGGLALALVVVVGGWALLGNRSDGNPLVYPWASGPPGEINVSVSMEPTDEPTVEPTATPATTSTGSPGITPMSASPAAGASVSKPGGLRVVQGQANRYQGGYVVHYIVTNSGATVAASWRMELWFSENFRLKDNWNANVTLRENRHLVLTSQRPVDPGATQDIGLRIEQIGSNLGIPMSCTLDGRSFTCAPRWSS